MAVPEVTIYNLLLKPQAFSFECLYLKKTTGNLSIYVPQKCPQKVGRETPFTVAVRRHGQKNTDADNRYAVLQTLLLGFSHCASNVGLHPRAILTL